MKKCRRPVEKCWRPMKNVGVLLENVGGLWKMSAPCWEMLAAYEKMSTPCWEMLAAYEKMSAPCWEMLAAYEKMLASCWKMLAGKNGAKKMKINKQKINKIKEMKNNPRNLRERTTEQLQFPKGTNNGMKKLSEWKKQNLKLGSAWNWFGQFVILNLLSLITVRSPLGFLWSLKCIKQRLFLALHFIHVYFSALFPLYYIL